MLNVQLPDYCVHDVFKTAKLAVVVDTEEEFHWTGEFSRNNTHVRSARYIDRAQAIFDQYHITPVYMVDYPVASQPDGYRPVQEIYEAGRCLVGAHLHPWVNPPFEEVVGRYNSFPGNLRPALEAAKLRILSECIAERFGCRPVLYKAGRCGIGPTTFDILEEQGFEVDLSVCPHMDYAAEGGPDFTYSSPWPYWFGRKRRLLELPLTVGFSGGLRRWGLTVHKIASRPISQSLHSIGILARLRLVNKIRLSPEGHTFFELQNLVRALSLDGLRIFSFAFHSPSLEPGHTPYVRSQHDLEQLLSCCRAFFDFFMGELGGQPATPLELKQQLTEYAGALQGKTS